MIATARGPHRKPVTNHRSGFFPQRQNSLSSSLAGDADGIEVRVSEIGDHDANQLRDSDPDLTPHRYADRLSVDRSVGCERSRETPCH